MTHFAALSLSKGTPLTLQSRPTPSPGPNDLLIAVKSIALNPADTIMHNTGLFIQTYPTVLGFDISGLVLETGENVPPHFHPGTRIAAYSASVWKGCNPDYGAFQERCLVPWEHAVPLPEGISWNEAATLPVAVQVPLSAWDSLGILRLGEGVASSGGRNQALLIWGASSSVGTMGVQTARLLRDRDSFGAVYATAGVANQEYIASLGADRVFDYKDPQVTSAIISAAKQDGLVIRHCFLATGELAACQAVLRAFAGDQGAQNQAAKIASAPIILSDAKEVDGVETVFVMPSRDEGERLAQFRDWMGWLREKLEQGRIRPSPEPRVVGRGLGGINEGLEVLDKGVSCTKLVVELESES